MWLCERAQLLLFPKLRVCTLGQTSGGNGYSQHGQAALKLESIASFRRLKPASAKQTCVQLCQYAAENAADRQLRQLHLQPIPACFGSEWK